MAGLSETHDVYNAPPIEPKEQLQSSGAYASSSTVLEAQAEPNPLEEHRITNSPQTRDQASKFSAAGWVLVFGVNSGLVYLLIFLLPYQLVPHYQMVQPYTWDFQHYSPQLLAVGWIVLFQIYYLAYRLCPVQPSRLVLGLLISFPVLFSVILLLMYPIGANDIFDQIFRGHTSAHLGVSPYLTTPSHFPADPLLPYVAWKDVPGTYGPIWQLLTDLTTRLVGPDLLANLIGYKLLVIAHFWASIPLVYRILRLLHPEYAVRGLLLFAWNPLILFEAATNAHNDFVLIFWVLVAIYLLVRARPELALLALMAGILVKFTPVLLVPLFLIVLWRAEEAKRVLYPIRRVLLVLAAMFALAVLAYLPFGIGAILSTASYANDMTGIFHNSTSWMILHLFQGGVIPEGPQGQTLVRNSLLLLMGAVVLWHSVRFWRHRVARLESVGDLLQRSFDILFIFLTVVTPWFHTWHVVWLIAFAPFLPRFGYAERTVVFFFLALSDYFIWWYRWPIGSPVLDVAETMDFWAIIPLPFLLSLGLWIYWQSGIRWPWLRHNNQEEHRIRGNSQTHDAVIKFSAVSKFLTPHHEHTRPFKDVLGRLFRVQAPSTNGVANRPIADEESWALREVDFKIYAGEAVAIIGEKGSGKSTTLKLIARIFDPTSGQVSVKGKVAALLEPSDGLQSELTGRESIFLNGALLGIQRKEIASRLETIANFGELDEFIDTPLKDYSSSMLIRLGFAMALNIDPDILVVDEAFALTDEAFQRKCLEHMELLRQRGGTIVYVPRALDSGQTLCKRAIWLDHGKVIADGPTDEVIEKYRKHEASNPPLMSNLSLRS
jgi:ABC-type polysaccharide/polyol phosphate transport system ATPase subunit